MSQENACSAGSSRRGAQRIRNRLSVALLAPSGWIVLTFIWELGEHAGDRSLDTTLTPIQRGAGRATPSSAPPAAWSGSRPRASARSGARRTEKSAQRPGPAALGALGRRDAFRVV